jgi:hypothetical protein
LFAFSPATTFCATHEYPTLSSPARLAAAALGASLVFVLLRLRSSLA